MHLDLTAPDRLFTNFINYQKKNRVIIDKKINQAIPHDFTRTETKGCTRSSPDVIAPVLAETISHSKVWALKSHHL